MRVMVVRRMEVRKEAKMEVVFVPEAVIDFVFDFVQCHDRFLGSHGQGICWRCHGICRLSCLG